MLSIRVGSAWNSGNPTGGRWLHDLASFGDLEFSTALRRPSDNDGGGGLLTAAWSMAVSSGRPLPSLVRQDSLVEVFAGSAPLGMGFIPETPRGNSVIVDGLFRLGEYFRALDASGLPTTNPRTAVQQAIVRGLRWRDPGAELPNGSVSSMSETQAQGNTVSAVLNAYCAKNGMWWYIDAGGFVRFTSSPGFGSAWSLSPSVAVPETADESFVSAFYIRRASTVTAGVPTAWASSVATDSTAPMIREDYMDLEQMGAMDGTAGTAAVTALLNANKARSGYSEGVSVQRGQVTTVGGAPPELWAPAAGDTMTQPNWLAGSVTAAQVDQGSSWTVGGTQWRQDEPLTITPIGLVPRTMASVVQDATGRPELTFK